MGKRNPHPMKRVQFSRSTGSVVPVGHVRFECQGDGCRWFVHAWKAEDGTPAMTTAARSIAAHKAEMGLR